MATCSEPSSHRLRDTVSPALDFPRRVVTYSPAYTLVPTYECFNRCTYCNFRADPGQSPWLTVDMAVQHLHRAQAEGVIEVLVLSGEVAPHSPRRRAWVRHIVQICELALSIGLLPHTNVGPLSWDEMAELKHVNVSMGLMVEQVTPSLLQTVHRYAPSKHPEIRLQQLTWAGKMGIPFTTGLLLGLGETQADWAAALEAIATIHSRYGHIQEVILQPHSLGQRQAEERSTLSDLDLVAAVNLATQILPAAVAIQIPPNLVSPTGLLACLDAGARDVGGISPVDEVNPDYAHPCPQHLAATLAQAGWQLRPRLPVYPQYDDQLPLDLRPRVKAWRHQLEGRLSSPPRLC
ncbi:MAG: 7,8-didemethyl-8-hydroxy-5-deazariboflavin synthase subunit CofG [Nodosilinea sp.]